MKKAESKRGRPKTTSGRGERATVCVFKGSPVYSEWVDGLARKDRRSVSSVIDQSLADYAAKIGHDAPPDRLGGAPEG